MNARQFTYTPVIPPATKPVDPKIERSKSVKQLIAGVLCRTVPKEEKLRMLEHLHGDVLPSAKPFVTKALTTLAAT